MAKQKPYQWRRDTDGLGVWEHRGKVAVAGFGHSPVDRRWDETSMDQTLGAYSMLACELAMEDAGFYPWMSRHVSTFIVIEDGRLNRRMPDQPYNLALITLDQDPSINFYSNLPGVPPYEVPLGAAVQGYS